MPRHQLIATIVIGALVHVAAFSEPALARSAAEKRGEQVRAAMVKMQVGRDTRVSVKLRNNNIVVGYLAAVSDHSFLVTDPDTHTSIQVPYRNVRQVNAMSTGAKIAVVAGVVAAVIVLAWCSSINSVGFCGIGG